MEVALSLAVLLAASFATTADAAKKKAAPADPAVAAQQNSNKFFMDAGNPYGTTSKPAETKKAAKKGKKKA